MPVTSCKRVKSSREPASAAWFSPEGIQTAVIRMLSEAVSQKIFRRIDIACVERDVPELIQDTVTELSTAKTTSWFAQFEAPHVNKLWYTAHSSLMLMCQLVCDGVQACTQQAVGVGPMPHAAMFEASVQQWASGRSTDQWITFFPLKYCRKFAHQ